MITAQPTCVTIALTNSRITHTNQYATVIHIVTAVCSDDNKQPYNCCLFRW